MKLNIVRANPAGNITLFVLDYVPAKDRAGISEKLIAIPEFKAEQVGFVTPKTPGTDGSMMMMAGEFCGNATRSYGMLLADINSRPDIYKNIDRVLADDIAPGPGTLAENGEIKYIINTSGMDTPVDVYVDLKKQFSKARMPLPLNVETVIVDGRIATVVDLGGIAHLVVEDVEPANSFFVKAEPALASIPDLDAYGVIFVNEKSGKMTPLVKVPATNTLIWEGSCGSGSIAACIAAFRDRPDGIYEKDFIQPAGTITASIAIEHGEITQCFIGGSVTIDEPVTVEI